MTTYDGTTSDNCTQEVWGDIIYLPQHMDGWWGGGGGGGGHDNT